MDKQLFLDTLLPAQPQMQLLASKLLGDGAEAEDTVQEVFAALWEDRKRLDRVINLQAYAMNMTRNRCIDSIRKKQPTVDIATIDFSDEDARREASLMDERAATLDRMMATLPERQREAVRMKYIEGASHEEMKARLGMSSENVYTTLSRAIAKLRTMIKQ